VEGLPWRDEGGQASDRDVNGLDLKAEFLGVGLECSGLGINHKAIHHGI